MKILSRQAQILIDLLIKEKRESELNSENFSLYTGTKKNVKMNVIEFDGTNEVLLIMPGKCIKTKIHWNETKEQSVIRLPEYGTIIL